jgi:intracellular sulfur oxidation DsrE/DsrF family protein
MTSILTIDTASAPLATLRAALQGADAYNGVARFNREAMADYARKVQLLRADGETAAISCDTVDALLEAPQPEPAAEVVVPEPAAEVVAEPQPEPTTDVAQLLAQVEQAVAQRTARRVAAPASKIVALIELLIKASTTDQNGDIVATAQQIRDLGFSKVYSTYRVPWCATERGGVAAASLGYTCSTRKAEDCFEVVFSAA